MFTRIILGMAAVSVIGMGCSSQQPTAPDVTSSGNSAALTKVAHNEGFASRFADLGENHSFSHDPVMFTVRIENVSTTMTLHLSNGETAPAPNSPGVWAITRLKNPLFTVGQYDAGLGLEQQAEDGDPSVLAGNIENDPRVLSSGVFNTPVGDDNPGPALPGKYYEFTVTASPGDRLSLTTMFGQSNDLFYSPGMVGIPLFRAFKPVNGDVTRFFKLWDAGTEVNQEPGLGSDQAPRQSGPNTGESEHMRIVPVHDDYTYPPTNEVIKVTITPMDAMSS
jgi:hypothetical protein